MYTVLFLKKNQFETKSQKLGGKQITHQIFLNIKN